MEIAGQERDDGEVERTKTREDETPDEAAISMISSIYNVHRCALLKNTKGNLEGTGCKAVLWTRKYFLMIRIEGSL